MDPGKPGVMPPDVYVASLARKRMAAGALCRDRAGRVLLVDPVYRETWDLPGGAVEAEESPQAACRREVTEELGLDRRWAGFWRWTGSRHAQSAPRASSWCTTVVSWPRMTSTRSWCQRGARRLRLRVPGPGATKSDASCCAEDLCMPGRFGRRHGGLARGWQPGWLIRPAIASRRASAGRRQRLGRGCRGYRPHRATPAGHDWPSPVENWRCNRPHRPAG